MFFRTEEDAATIATLEAEPGQLRVRSATIPCVFESIPAYRDYKKRDLKASALAKLTSEEKAALGLS